MVIRENEKKLKKSNSRQIVNQIVYVSRDLHNHKYKAKSITLPRVAFHWLTNTVGVKNRYFILLFIIIFQYFNIKFF
jgi:hypothetical protein